MHTKIDLKGLSANIVYLKPVATADLPDEVRAQAGDTKMVFAVHNGEGEHVAFVANEAIATHLAAEHKMQLVTLH